jgi:hypothetical protein
MPKLELIRNVQYEVPSSEVEIVNPPLTIQDLVLVTP